MLSIMLVYINFNLQPLDVRGICNEGAPTGRISWSVYVSYVQVHYQSRWSDCERCVKMERCVRGPATIQW